MIASEYRAAVTKAMPEDALQTLILNLAHRLGWLTFHDHDSRRNTAGLPDLILVRGNRLIFAEIKSETGRLREAQKTWLAALNQTPAETHVLRPADWFDGSIRHLLEDK